MANVLVASCGRVEFGYWAAVILGIIETMVLVSLLHVFLDEICDCFYRDREVKLVQLQMA